MTKSDKSGSSFLRFVLTPKFWAHLVLILGFFLVCGAFTFGWLKQYTHHNQKLELPGYVEWDYDEALEDASDKSFRMAILDSIHVVGKEGNLILQQDPIAGSMVKENRTIYVTITKKTADKIAMGRLPLLYGKHFPFKQRELAQSFELECVVVGRRFDPGEPDQILEVRYNGEVVADKDGRKDDVMIEKGTRLEFVVSERRGGELNIPDLTCMTFAEAQFLIESSGLELGEVITDGSTGVADTAYVSGQVPDPAEGVIYMGDVIRLSLTRSKPFHCN